MRKTLDLLDRQQKISGADESQTAFVDNIKITMKYKSKACVDWTKVFQWFHECDCKEASSQENEKVWSKD